MTETLAPALLNFGYWPEVQRGNERIVNELATQLVAGGHRPAILTSHPGPPSRTVEKGVKVVRSWRPPEGPLRLRKIQANLTHLPFSYMELRRGDFDLAHAFHATDALAAVRWSELEGRPAIYTMTGIPGRENVSSVRLRKRVLEIATTRSREVLVLSQAARDAMWRWLGIEARVIYPGVDLGRFRTVESRAEVPTIVCAADPTDQRKRVGLLVEAFAELRRDRPGAELVLVAPSAPEIARELAGRPGVRMHPAGIDAPVEMFGSAWISALPSFNEAFGLVVVESLACGRPVVGARSGALPEIIDRPKVGTLFEGDDPRDVARSLLEALELAQDAETPAACRRHAERFSSERTAIEHESLYRDLLAA